MREMQNTGVKLTLSQLDKAKLLAQQLGISRNKLFGLLIENAEIECRPVIRVELDKNKNSLIVSDLAERTINESMTSNPS